MERKDVSEAVWSPASGTSVFWDGSPLKDLENVRKHAESPLEGGRDQNTPSSYLPRDNSDVQVGGSASPSPGVIPVPFPRLSLFSFHPRPHFRSNFHLLRPPLIRTALASRHR